MNKDDIYVLSKNYVIGVKMAINSGLDMDNEDMELYNKCVIFVEDYEKEQ